MIYCYSETPCGEHVTPDSLTYMILTYQRLLNCFQGHRFKTKKETIWAWQRRGQQVKGSRERPTHIYSRLKNTSQVQTSMQGVCSARATGVAGMYTNVLKQPDNVVVYAAALTRC